MTDQSDAIQQQGDAVIDRLVYVNSRERYEGSLWEFVRDAWKYIDSSEFQTSWCIEALCDHLEAVTMGHIPRLLINIPPRTGKTLITSVCWPAWTWAREEKTFLSGPQVRWLCGSYNDDLALMAATRTRRLILSPFYQKFWGKRFMMAWDQASKTHFENTQGGARIATSVRGSLLGLGGDVICVDDPHNTETEKVVETDADRKRVHGWWRELSGTRLNDPKQSAIVVCMQRLHQEDLSGIILDSDEDWVHLMIPMRYDSGRETAGVTVVLPPYGEDRDAEPWSDPRIEECEEEGHDGQLMWPERFGEVQVRRMEEQLGPYMSSGRLQQMPVPKGGGIIQRVWWRQWDEEEAQKYGLVWSGARKEFPEFNLVIASLDTNFGIKQENDYNALTVWGIFNDKVGNRRAMMAYAWNKRLPLHGEVVSAFPNETKLMFEERQKQSWGLVEWVADTCKRYRVKRLLIENKARGYDVANEIQRLYRRDNWGVELREPVGDKVSRGHSVVPLFTDGVVWAPRTRWADAVIDQCALVPKAAHDDMYDTVTMFLHWARENGIIERADEVSAALAEEAAYQPKTQSVAELYGV